MNPASKPFQAGLLLSSVAMFVAAGAIWSSKVQRNSGTPAAIVDTPSTQKHAAEELLSRSYHADNELSYSALSSTVAFMGGKSLTSTAQITRAPHKLSIKMLSGSMSGVESGYSQRWLWRKDAGQNIRPYAEVEQDANQMAAKRFALLTKNYKAIPVGQKQFEGYTVSVLELFPLNPQDGAKGPARRLYIDQISGLTVGIEAFNCDLKPVMKSSLSQLNLQPQLQETSFEPPAAIMASLKDTEWRGEDLGRDKSQAAEKSGFKPAQPTSLPPGFELDGYGVHRCHTTGTLQLAAFTRYTDGINTLTLFAFKPVNAAIAKNMRGQCNFGPGTMSSRESNGGRLVAIGDLPSKTLERVLASANFETAK